MSYFYRFAERHIDGETSAVSSAADVQAMQDVLLAMCVHGTLFTMLTALTTASLQAMQDSEPKH